MSWPCALIQTRVGVIRREAFGIMCSPNSHKPAFRMSVQNLKVTEELLFRQYGYWSKDFGYPSLSAHNSLSIFDQRPITSYTRTLVHFDGTITMNLQFLSRIHIKQIFCQSCENEYKQGHGSRLKYLTYVAPTLKLNQSSYGGRMRNT